MAKIIDCWKGKNFMDWCKAQVDDHRKINYTLTLYYWVRAPKTRSFTSEDKVDWTTLNEIGDSFIEDVSLINNEWYFKLHYYDLDVYENLYDAWEEECND